MRDNRNVNKISPKLITLSSDDGDEKNGVKEEKLKAGERNIFKATRD
jgi:hypothetical protein